ncbi:MAG: hypothetical protein ISS31_02250 [Kiritimatiellae bacterium]|nr:hypothetical protein [Kiritimatiellia bacterium]
MQTNATLSKADRECENATDETGVASVPLLFGKREFPGMAARDRASAIATRIYAGTKTITEVQKENVDAD